MPYACTYVKKEISLHNSEAGCETERSRTIDRQCNIVGVTLKGLFQEIGDEFGLEINDIFIPDLSNVVCVGFNRLEDSSGDPVSEREIEELKSVNRRLWLADYSFHISFRTVRKVTKKELVECGIAIH